MKNIWIKIGVILTLAGTPASMALGDLPGDKVQGTIIRIESNKIMIAPIQKTDAPPQNAVTVETSGQTKFTHITALEELKAGDEIDVEYRANAGKNEASEVTKMGDRDTRADATTAIEKIYNSIGEQASAGPSPAPQPTVPHVQ